MNKSTKEAIDAYLNQPTGYNQHLIASLLGVTPSAETTAIPEWAMLLQSDVEVQLKSWLAGKEPTLDKLSKSIREFIAIDPVLANKLIAEVFDSVEQAIKSNEWYELYHPFDQAKSCL